MFILFMFDQSKASTFNQTPPSGARVKLCGSNLNGISVLALTLNLNLLKSTDNPTLVCVEPKRIPKIVNFQLSTIFEISNPPMQILGPSPNGRKVQGAIFFRFSSLKRSGSKESGSGKKSGS